MVLERMHRTHLGGLLGVLVIPAAAIWWPLGLVFAGGVVWTRALTGAFGALVGLAVLFPIAAVPLALAAVVAVWLRHKFPPGAILDTARARLLSWLYLVKSMHPLGRGPGSARLALEAAFVRTGGRSMDGGPARNEPLELVYEYGLFAVSAFATVLWLAYPHLHWGDPGTATVASTVAVCSVTSPIRAFWQWLRGDRATIFGPPLSVSISVHVDSRGEVMIYGAQTMDENRERQLQVARALVLALNAWHEAYDIRPEEIVYVR